MNEDPTIFAYLAGVIDSDGFITTSRTVGPKREYFSALVGISGTRRAPHDLAASIWGGNVSRYVPTNPQHRPQFQWLRSGDAAVPVITSILPYLRVKVEQALLALDLQEHVICGRGDDPFPWLSPSYDPTPYRKEIRARMIALNQSKSRSRNYTGEDR